MSDIIYKFFPDGTINEIIHPNFIYYHFRPFNDNKFKLGVYSRKGNRLSIIAYWRLKNKII